MLMTASRSVATADRVLQVLAELAKRGRALTAADLMQITGLARSTLYRQLSRLKQWGFVSEIDGSYAPGPLSLQLALGFDLASNLVQVARPDMTALAKQSRESVGLIVPVKDQAVCLEMVESEQSLRCSFEKGRSVPLKAGASANCLLAHLPAAQRHAILDRHYRHGSAEWNTAEQELQAIQEAGLAVSAGKVDPGVWGVSAPIFGAPGHAVAALTLMAPLSRVQGREAALMKMTKAAAARMSRQLTPP
jgi:DNA-binding IclR family transcriptional regulator